MTDEKFKMPQSSYEELTKVIKAYGHVTEPVGLEDVSRLVGLHTTIISRNAGFLTGAGILEPGQKKIATSLGRNLAHALEHEMPDEIRKCWRSVIDQTDFLTKILTAIKIRNGMDSSTLEAHVAYSAGQPKKPQFMTGARTIIDIIRAAELVTESDGKLVYAGGEGSPESIKDTELPPSIPATSTTPVSTVARQVVVAESQTPNCQIRINVSITCTPNDLDGLGAKLRNLLDTIGERTEPGVTPDTKE